MNGYTNAATYNFRLWHFDAIQEIILDDFLAYVDFDVSELADDIEAMAFEMTGLNKLPIGFVRDAAMAEYNQINFIELAEMIMKAGAALDLDDDEEE